jgi:hypothetical protein
MHREEIPEDNLIESDRALYLRVRRALKAFFIPGRPEELLTASEKYIALPAKADILLLLHSIRMHNAPPPAGNHKDLQRYSIKYVFPASGGGMHKDHSFTA